MLEEMLWGCVVLMILSTAGHRPLLIPSSFCIAIANSKSKCSNTACTSSTRTTSEPHRAATPTNLELPRTHPSPTPLRSQHPLPLVASHSQLHTASMGAVLAAWPSAAPANNKSLPTPSARLLATRLHAKRLGRGCVPSHVAVGGERAGGRGGRRPEQSVLQKIAFTPVLATLAVNS